MKARLRIMVHGETKVQSYIKNVEMSFSPEREMTFRVLDNDSLTTKVMNSIYDVREDRLEIDLRHIRIHDSLFINVCSQLFSHGWAPGS